MKLIFDQNLSPKLIQRLQDLFPGSTHASLCGLGTSMDLKVWKYAKANGFNIVSKDADYGEICMKLGYPPKIIWIQRSNCSTTQIEELIRRDIEYIRLLDSNPELSIVSIGLEESPTAQEPPAVYVIEKKKKARSKKKK
jgi:predicted nuclease of predicted toxin-antitoxin system